MRQTEPDDSLQMRFYRLGVQAHTDGMSVNSCDSTDPVRRAWFKAGWHDADIDAGNSVFNRKAAWSDPALEAFEQYRVKQ